MHPFPGRRAWLAVAATATASSIWFITGGAVLPFEEVLPLLVLLGMLAILYCLTSIVQLKTGGSVIMERLRLALFGYIFILIGSNVLSVFNSAVMASALPYVDANLAKADAFLRFDWISYYTAMVSDDGVSWLFGLAYDSFAYTALFSFMLFCAGGDFTRSRFLVEAFWLSALLCVVIGMFTPAEGATAFHLEDAVAPEVFATLPGTHYLDYLDRVRTAWPLTVRLQDLQGLTTFPSFHTAGSVVVACSFWRTRLFLPAALCAGVTIVATPVYGGHYLVDLLGGCAVAIASLLTLASLPSYKRLFAATGVRQDRRGCLPGRPVLQRRGATGSSVS
ncbi:phosphatase PAP2 family protein [Geminicoccaceae bacterium 1502E]|nr:phosphatase PAP2 family protein [Geminicoccaceae bacterium 1502E]